MVDPPAHVGRTRQSRPAGLCLSRAFRGAAGGCLRCLDSDEAAVTDRGFSLVELLVAGAIFTSIAAAIGLLAAPLNHRIERGFGDSDVTARARSALVAIADDLQDAGNGAALGDPAWTLHDILPVVVPHRS